MSISKDNHLALVEFEKKETKVLASLFLVESKKYYFMDYEGGCEFDFKSFTFPASHGLKINVSN